MYMSIFITSFDKIYDVIIHRLCRILLALATVALSCYI